MTTPLPPELERYRGLTPSEAGAILGLRVGTLANMRMQSRGPRYFVVGRSVRYELADVLAWRDRGRVIPAGTES